MTIVKLHQGTYVILIQHAGFICRWRLKRGTRCPKSTNPKASDGLTHMNMLFTEVSCLYPAAQDETRKSSKEDMTNNKRGVS